MPTMSDYNANRRRFVVPAAILVRLSIKKLGFGENENPIRLHYSAIEELTDLVEAAVLQEFDNYRTWRR